MKFLVIALLASIATASTLLLMSLLIDMGNINVKQDEVEVYLSINKSIEEDIVMPEPPSRYPHCYHCSGSGRDWWIFVRKPVKNNFPIVMVTKEEEKQINLSDIKESLSVEFLNISYNCLFHKKECANGI